MYRDSYVVKPWGWEYLMYENKNVALWCLHINPNEATSMHCHSHKTTGLVLLEGSAIIKFLADEHVIHAPHKQMIRRGLFHSTCAMANDVVLLEIETPNDKTDLIRLNDGYGRQDAGYELASKMLPKTEDMLWINEQGMISGTGLQYGLSTQKLSSLQNQVLEDTDIYIILQGRIYKEVYGKKCDMLIAGDVGLGKIMNVVFQEATGCSRNTLLLRIPHDGK